MVSGKRLADIGYRAFSTSMMLLTLYGGYLCAIRGYRYMQKQKELKLAAENQDPEVIKEWCQTLLLLEHTWTFPIPLAYCPLLNHDVSQEPSSEIIWRYCALTRNFFPPFSSNLRTYCWQLWLVYSPCCEWECVVEDGCNCLYNILLKAVSVQYIVVRT